MSRRNAERHINQNKVPNRANNMNTITKKWKEEQLWGNTFRAIEGAISELKLAYRFAEVGDNKSTINSIERALNKLGVQEDPQQLKFIPSPVGLIEGDTFARVCSITGEGMNCGWIAEDYGMYFKNEADALRWAQVKGYQSIDEAYEDEVIYYTEWEERVYIVTVGKLVEIEEGEIERNEEGDELVASCNRCGNDVNSNGWSKTDGICKKCAKG